MSHHKFEKNGTVTQGATLGLEAFYQIIKDMRSGLAIFKYIKHSTFSEVISKNHEIRRLQAAVDKTVQWTRDNAMLVNTT